MKREMERRFWKVSRLFKIIKIKNMNWILR